MAGILGCNNCNARNKASLWFSRQERSPAQSLLLALALCQAASGNAVSQGCHHCVHKRAILWYLTIIATSHAVELKGSMVLYP